MYVSFIIYLSAEIYQTINIFQDIVMNIYFSHCE